MTPVFLQIGLGFSPFHAGLMMIPMVLGSMGMKRIVVQVVNRFGYRRVLVFATLGLALVSLLFMAVALAGWYWLLPLVLFLQGMINSSRFSSMNTLTLKDLPDELASSGNSLLSMVMQLSMSIGVTIAGLLLGMYAPAYQRRCASCPSGFPLYLSEHGGDYRSPGAHLFPTIVLSSSYCAPERDNDRRGRAAWRANAGRPMPPHGWRAILGCRSTRARAGPAGAGPGRYPPCALSSTA